LRAAATYYCFKFPDKQDCISSRLKKADPNNNLWVKFDATEGKVLGAADLKLLQIPLKENAIVSETFKLIASGYPMIKPLLNTFAKVSADNTNDNNKDDDGASGGDKDASKRSVSVAT